MRHAGLVLAAGASSRMGSPKALLKDAQGAPLAARQIQLLKQAGCARALAVLGCDAERIRMELPGCEIVINPGWRKGRFGSILAGLSSTRAFDGVLILPVDTVGVKASTLQALLAQAEALQAPSVRPVFGGEPGKILWLSRGAADQLLALQPEDRDFRLDQWIADKAVRFPVQDEAILNNINTPEEWARIRGGA